MERGARKVVLEIVVAQKKNEDIQPILEKYADRDRKGKTSAVRMRCKARKHFRDMDFANAEGNRDAPSTPPGPEEEPEIVASEPPPQGHNSGSRGGGATSTDSNACSGDKGKGTALDFPSHPDGTSRGLPATPGLWETSGIPWIDLQLPYPHHDPTAFPLYATVWGALAYPNVDTGRGRLSGLEGQLKEALQTFRASELHEACEAILKAKAENDRLDKLWRDTEAYWEDHLKNSTQLEMLANNRLRTFEAKIRKKKKDVGLVEPDPEDFIPRNYFRISFL
ncbi:OLC1v1036019C1 [Oldenlandia corymbosa var. corymbosa]|uniref:OLC1v1036019C1 n=1 Tax=Oldenlandia corymbosa var. corymbosa TaxID=529605 RepID=A0AAV1CWW8_OLDCO|nr:OLC1v1036019C1 [Oldenlandia corymbosa var. corymbosa]